MDINHFGLPSTLMEDMESSFNHQDKHMNKIFNEGKEPLYLKLFKEYHYKLMRLENKNQDELLEFLDQFVA